MNTQNIEQESINYFLNEEVSEIEINSRIVSFLTRKEKKRKIKIKGFFGATLLVMSRYQNKLVFDADKLGSIDYLSEIKKNVLENTFYMNRIIACAVINNYWIDKIFGHLLAWYLMDRQTTKQLQENYTKIEIQADYVPFASTIVLMSSKRVTKPTETIVENQSKEG
jgi:hypothetical protein